jgi:hypothetical protein
MRHLPPVANAAKPGRQFQRGAVLMSVQTILLPLFVQVLLTFYLGFYLAILRRQSLSRRETRWQDISLREPGWPKHTMQVGNSFANQFELPVLFYVVTILALVTKQADLVFVVLAWIFVIARLVHAYIHVTNNYVPRRGLAFAASCATVFIIWVVFMIRIVIAA